MWSSRSKENPCGVHRAKQMRVEFTDAKRIDVKVIDQRECAWSSKSKENACVNHIAKGARGDHRAKRMRVQFTEFARLVQRAKRTRFTELKEWACSSQSKDNAGAVHIAKRMRVQLKEQRECVCSSQSKENACAVHRAKTMRVRSPQACSFELISCINEGCCCCCCSSQSKEIGRGVQSCSIERKAIYHNGVHRRLFRHPYTSNTSEWLYLACSRRLDCGEQRKAV